jgi:hypothetical protein
MGTQKYGSISHHLKRDMTPDHPPPRSDPATPQTPARFQGFGSFFEKIFRLQRAPVPGNEKSQGGYTIVELFIGMCVTFIVVGGTVWIMMPMVKSHNTQVRTQTMRQNGHAAKNFIEDYLRGELLSNVEKFADVGFGCEINGTEYDISDTRLAFTTDLGRCTNPLNCADTYTTDPADGGPNGEIDDSWVENVVIEYDNDEARLIRRQMDGDRLTLATNIDAMRFFYLDEDGNPTTRKSEIRSVEITMVMRHPDSGGMVHDHFDNDTYLSPHELDDGTFLLSLKTGNNPPKNNPPQDEFRRMQINAQVAARNIK